VATQTEGDRRRHVLLAGRTMQLRQGGFKDVGHRRKHAAHNEIVMGVGVNEGHSFLKVQQMNTVNKATEYQQRRWLYLIKSG